MNKTRRSNSLGGLDELARVLRPDSIGWQRLCDRLDALPDSEIACARQLLDPVLGRWDDDQRSALPGWIARLASGQNEPRMAFCAAVVAHQDRLDAETGLALATSAELSSIRSIGLYFNDTTRETLTTLLSSPHLSRIEELRLVGNEVDETLVRHLARIEALDSLKVLLMDRNPLSDTGLAAIANGPWVPTLERLSVDRASIGSSGIQRLAATDFPRLRALQLRSNTIGPSGISALTHSRSLAGLEILDLGWNRTGDVLLKSLRSGDALHRLRHLVLNSNRFTADGAGMLAEIQNLPGLQQLDIGFNRFGDAGIKAIARNRSLVSLNRLRCPYIDATRAGILTLVNSPLAERLLQLDLGGNRQIGRHGALTLFQSALVERLEQLELENLELDEACMAELTWGGLTNMRTLNLASTGLTSADAGLLADTTAPNLRYLNLSSNEIGPLGFGKLAQSPFVAGLEALDLGRNPLGESIGSLSGLESTALIRLNLRQTELENRGVALLGACEGFSDLHELNVSQNRIDSTGLVSWLEAANCRDLDRLDLSENQIDGGGVQALVNTTTVRRLRTLDLSANPIGDSGAQALANSSQLTKLRSLILTSCGISDSGARALANSPLLGLLIYLNLRENPISESACDELKASPYLRRCRIYLGKQEW